MSKSSRGPINHGAHNPSAPNIRDPEQHNDELERHTTPKREDPTQRDKVMPPKHRKK